MVNMRSSHSNVETIPFNWSRYTHAYICIYIYKIFIFFLSSHLLFFCFGFLSYLNHSSDFSLFLVFSSVVVILDLSCQVRWTVNNPSWQQKWSNNGSSSPSSSSSVSRLCLSSDVLMNSWSCLALFFSFLCQKELVTLFRFIFLA